MHVEFYVDDAEDPIGTASEWDGDLPLPEDLFTTGGVTYQVVERNWGTMCKGDGSPLWNSPCCSVILTELTS